MKKQYHPYNIIPYNIIPIIKTHPKNLPVWVVAAGVVAERVEAVVAVTEAVGGASRATG